MISLSTSAWVYGAWRIALNANQYTPGIFVVESTAYWYARKSTFIEAKGTIDGNAEELALRSFGAKSRTAEALKQEFPRGTQLKVWYDPSASDIRIQGDNLRLLPRSYNLKQATFTAVGRTITCNLLTLIGGTVFFVSRKENRESSLKKHQSVG